MKVLGVEQLQLICNGHHARLEVDFEGGIRGVVVLCDKDAEILATALLRTCVDIRAAGNTCTGEHTLPIIGEGQA
jgi:hypothetical protein